MTEPTPPRPTPPAGLRLRDMIGLVVGYGLAALLIRSILPSFQTATFGSIIVFGFLYLWSGLAMSGPIVLSTARHAALPDDGIARSEPRSRFSRGESAWILIGCYLIATTIFVSFVRHGRFDFFFVLLCSEVALALGLVSLIRFRPTDRDRASTAAPSWTEFAARLMLATWFPAWILFIVFTKR